MFPYEKKKKKKKKKQMHIFNMTVTSVQSFILIA